MSGARFLVWTGVFYLTLVMILLGSIVYQLHERPGVTRGDVEEMIQHACRYRDSDVRKITELCAQ